MSGTFKSEQGKSLILELYNDKLKSLDLSYEALNISTSYGLTHVIIVGNEEKPPLLLIHGSNACAPISLELFPKLKEHYRVYAVDIPGQPNKSEGGSISMKDESYANWTQEVLSFLKVKDVTLVGFSLGGLVILKTLIHAPKNIKSAFLICPAFIVNGNPLKAIFKIFIPMRQFMRNQKDIALKRFIDSLFTTPDPFAFKYLSKVLFHFKLDFTPVPVITKKEAKKITTPLTIFAAKKDILFPGEKLLKRANSIFTSLIYQKLLTSSKHVQTEKDNQFIENKIIELLNSGA